MPYTSLSSNNPTTFSVPADSNSPLKCRVSMTDFHHPPFRGQNVPEPLDICAKLVAFRDGRREAILLRLNRPAIIGRNPDLCSYVVNDVLVSGVHCKLYAVRSPSGGIIISCQDLSRNGIILNGQFIRKTSIILMDGDVIQLPTSNSLTFTCVHIWKEHQEKLTLFEPTPPLRPAHKYIGNYIVTSQCLGSGSFATVNLAIDPARYRQVACKSIRTKRDYDVDQVMKEVRILMTLKHPNINEIYDTEENKKFIHIFLQLCTGGDLFTYIHHTAGTGAQICESEAKYIMYQLLQGLKYLHEKMISHRGAFEYPSLFKPENILLHCPGPYPRILIADFGLARPNSYQETFNVCGTVSYLPPEGILALDNKHLGYIGMPSDCWSAGVILYIMLCGSHPFDHDLQTSSNWVSDTSGSHDHDLESSLNWAADTSGSPTPRYKKTNQQTDMKVKDRIVHGSVEFFENPWSQLADARSLVNSLLVYDHVQRATVHSALKSKWIDSELDELESLYQTRIETENTRNTRI